MHCNRQGHDIQFRGIHLVTFSCFQWLTEFERFLNQLRFQQLGKFVGTVVSEGKKLQNDFANVSLERVNSQIIHFFH